MAIDQGYRPQLNTEKYNVIQGSMQFVIVNSLIVDLWKRTNENKLKKIKMGIIGKIKRIAGKNNR